MCRVSPFRPTGATTLPEGDLLVLERRFSILGGLGIRIRRIDQAKVRPDALLEGEAVAEFRPPSIYDNMEGIGVHTRRTAGPAFIFCRTTTRTRPSGRS